MDMVSYGVRQSFFVRINQSSSYNNGNILLEDRHTHPILHSSVLGTLHSIPLLLGASWPAWGTNMTEDSIRRHNLLPVFIYGGGFSLVQTKKRQIKQTIGLCRLLWKMNSHCMSAHRDLQRTWLHTVRLSLDLLQRRLWIRRRRGKTDWLLLNDLSFSG